MAERISKRAAAALLTLLTACGGGSGSTGLILPESAVLAEVRRDGTCVESEGTLYCATDSPLANAPDGQRAETDFQPGVPSPCDPQSTPACPTIPPVVLRVSGFGPDAACALASRPLGSSEAWTTGPLISVGGETTSLDVPPADSPTDGPREIVLLCFDPRPDTLASTLDTLASSGADVIFVPPLP